MALFQQSVVNKYIEMQAQETLDAKWDIYKNHFLSPTIQNEIRNFTEIQYQGGFLTDLFVNILGYTRPPMPNFNLTTELKNVNDAKRVDGAILLAGEVHGVIELKDTKTTDLKKVEPQAFGYKHNHPNCIYVITSNFEKLRFYVDNAVEHLEFNLFALTKEEFALLYLCLSYQSISQNLPKKIKEESIGKETEITESLYKDYSHFKQELYENLLQLNTIEPELLLRKTQKLLDRFLFLCFAEDKLLLPSNSVRSVLDRWINPHWIDDKRTLYNMFKKYFDYLNTGFHRNNHEIFNYNGGLFKADETLDALLIDDEVLYQNMAKLADYNFASEVDVNILGRIFENSLNSTSRKKEGVFYTPRYITKYIVENTVGKLCQEQKEKLEFREEEFAITQPQTKNKKEKELFEKEKKRLLEKISAYREWLLQLTILDPACGSGAFLNEALQFLIEEHKYIDKLQAKLLRDSLSLENITNEILENNIFGVDLNEESVEIAKLSLWLRTAQRGRKLSSLTDNIKCGNSLIDDAQVAGNKAFNWQENFPKVFEKGGFDVVIGNPPYFNIETLGVGSKEAKWIQKNYAAIWQDKSDILFYFFYKAMQISKSEIGFITSNAFLRADKAQKLRNKMITDNRLSKIINFEQFLIFDDAAITSCITLFSKNKKNTQALILKENKYEVPQLANILENEEIYFDVFLKENDIFSLDRKEIENINSKVDGTHKQLQEIVLTGSGMQTAANEVFSFNIRPYELPKEYIKKRIIGENISRYFYKEQEDYLLYFENIASFEQLPLTIQKHLNKHKIFLEGRATVRNEGRPWWRFSRPMHKEYYHLKKIWCSYRAKENEFVLDETNEYIGLTNTTVIFDTNKDYDLKYILVLLNSKLLNLRYKSIGKQTGSGVYEYFANGVGKLPIPQLSIEEQQSFIEKADKMILLHRDLQKFSQKVQRSIMREFSLNNLTKKLESWYSLSFHDFVEELEKKKGKLKLAQKNEWEEFFMQESPKSAEIALQISETDKEIDQMVYKLYGLTPEEIAIVEKG